MEVALQVMPLDKFPVDVLKELGLHDTWINEVLKFMLYKGIKYIPAIGYSAFMLLPSYNRPMDYFMRVPPEYNKMLISAYRQLRKRVEGVRTVRSGERLWEEGWREIYGVTRVIWPPVVLDLKEVQDEITHLLGQDLLSKDDPEDRMRVKDFLVNEVGLGEEMLEELLDTRVDKKIEGINRSLKSWGKFFAKLLEIRRKYTDAKFYLFAMAV